MGSRKGSKNKFTEVYTDVKATIIKDGMRANSGRLEYLKNSQPETYLRVINKLLKL